MDIGEKSILKIKKRLKSFPKAKKTFELLINNEKIKSTLDMSNTMMVRRYGYTDHGLSHALIVTANALKIVQILEKNKIIFDAQEIHHFTKDDIRCIIICASFLHDVGNSLHRTYHSLLSVELARPFLEKIYSKVYKDKSVAQTMLLETLHCIYTHDAYNNPDLKPMTLEAKIVSVADGTDLTQGRSRIPFRLGKVDIHSVSAMSIEKISIDEGKTKAVQISVSMKESAGVFQVQRILGDKIKIAELQNLIEVEAHTHPTQKGLKLQLEF